LYYVNSNICAIFVIFNKINVLECTFGAGKHVRTNQNETKRNAKICFAGLAKVNYFYYQLVKMVQEERSTNNRVLFRNKTY